MVVTPEVLLGSMPGVLLVTLKVIVQLLLAGMVTPVKVRAVAPAARVLGVVPRQVPPTAPPDALIFASVSLNVPPVSGKALVLAKVRVTTEAPPEEIVAGAKAFDIVGSAITVREAMGAAGPGVGVWVVVTPEAALVLVPRTLLVTLKITVQLPLGRLGTRNPRIVAPAVRVLGVVPAQVPVTAPPDAVMLTKVSENEALVRAIPLLLANVNFNADVPPG